MLSASDFMLLAKKRFEDLPEVVLHRLESRHFIVDEAHETVALMLMANRYRSRKEYLVDSTALHMLVVTLRCNHRCEYCQVSSREEDAYKYDMSPAVAERIVDMVFQSPSPVLKIEFQGGDALLNWPAVMAAVNRAVELNLSEKRQLEFVVCTNLYALDEAKLEDIRNHKIYLSTSLDGPAWLHDKHRLLRAEGSSYSVYAKKLSIVRQQLGDEYVSALMTTTRDSLEHVESVIDEYRKLGFNGVFFRALNPYGEALRIQHSYTPRQFFEMFRRGVEYIVKLNQEGQFFVEYYTALLMSRILTPFSTGFVDLQSPSGAGIGGVIYDYTGDVYPADEARMLARMGDTRFKMGNVCRDTYKQIFLGDVLKQIVGGSCLETIPGCATCVYRTYCGVDVFRNYLEFGAIDHVRQDGFFCQKQTLIFDWLFRKMDDPAFMKVIYRWIGV